MLLIDLRLLPVILESICIQQRHTLLRDSNTNELNARMRPNNIINVNTKKNKQNKNAQ